MNKTIISSFLGGENKTSARPKGKYLDKEYLEKTPIKFTISIDVQTTLKLIKENYESGSMILAEIGDYNVTSMEQQIADEVRKQLSKNPKILKYADVKQSTAMGSNSLIGFPNSFGYGTE